MADIRYKVDVDAQAGINNLKQLQEQLQKNSSALSGLKNLAVAAAAALGTGALVSSIKNAMNSVDGLAKSARALGTTTANFQALARSASLAGISLGELQATSQRLQSTLVNAIQKGSSDAANGLNTLGLSAKELVNLPIDQQLSKITEALRNVENPAQRTALSIELLGKQGPRMLEVADNAERMRKEMESAGLALSQIDSTAIEQANDAVSELLFVFESVRQKIAAELAPWITVIATRIKETVLGGRELGAAIRESVVPAILLATKAALIFAGVFIGGKLAAAVLTVSTAIISMYKALISANAAAALLNATLGKNPLLKFAGVLAGVAAAFGIFKIVENTFEGINEEVDNLIADIKRQQDELNNTAGAVVDVGDALKINSAEYKKQQDFISQQTKAIQDQIVVYRQANKDFNERFALQTKLINSTDEQKLRLQTLFELEKSFSNQRMDLEKRLADIKASAKTEELALIPVIQKALKDLNEEYENQVTIANDLVNSRLKELEIQKEQLRLQQQLEEAAKRREAVEDAVRGVMLDGMERIRREMERAELDGLVGIQRALKEIELEERRVAEAAKRRVAEQFGDNDPAGLMQAMEEIERASQAITQRRQAAIQSIIEEQRTFADGWKKSFKEYADNATNAARQAQRIFATTTRTMEDSIVGFAKTGKFEFKNFVNTVLEELLRIQIQKTFAQLLGGGGGSSSGGGSLFGGFFATGGMIPPGRFGVVGEAGPELVQGPAEVTPLTGTSVTYNINAVDASSFKELLARDPSFLFAVTEQGRRRAPGTRR